MDLAGSEKVSNHNGLPEVLCDNAGKLKDDRIKEGKSINKSLFFLTQVISMMAEGKQEHIPYRNSPLTKILKSSLGGNSRTQIFLCATPMNGQYEQTLSTIRFGMSAKKIENRIFANVTSHKSEEAYQLLIDEYEERLKSMEEQRSSDSKRNDFMMKTISELQRQREALNDRLRKINVARLSRAIKSTATGKVCERADANKREFCRALTGLIFTSARADYIPELGAERAEQCAGPDRRGVFALAALRNAKERAHVLEQKVASLTTGLNDLHTAGLAALDESERASERQRLEANGRLNASRSAAHRLADFARQLQDKLEFVETLRGIENVSETRLAELEARLMEQLGTVKVQ